MGAIKSLFSKAGAIQKNGILVDLATLPLPWSGSGHGGTWAPTREPQINAAVPGGSDGKDSAINAGDWGSIPGSGRSPGGGNDNPLQHSCLEIPWTEEPGGLQSIESRKVRHDCYFNSMCKGPETRSEACRKYQKPRCRETGSAEGYGECSRTVQRPQGKSCKMSIGG